MKPAPGELWQINMMDVAVVTLLVVGYVQGVHGSDAYPEQYVKCLILTSTLEQEWPPGTMRKWHPGHFATPNVRLS